MIDLKKGTWLLATKGRPDSVKRFLVAAREMGTSTSGLIVVNETDMLKNKGAYDALNVYLMPGWKFHAVDAESYGAALRAMWNCVKDMDWVGLVADDHVPCSSGWDASLLSSLQGWNMVSSADGWQATTSDIARSRIHGAIAMSGALMRAIGWIFPPMMKHVFHDDMLESIGRETSCWQIRQDILVKHLHEALNGVRGPTMDRESALWKHDEPIYREWMATEKEATVTRVKALMESFGVKFMEPDLKGFKVMIATPSIDGKYHGDYIIGLFTTMEVLRQKDVPTQWSEERHTADIALARSKLMAQFRRSDCTHLLLVDSDMGWIPQDVLRLFCCKADFAAVAGPKKRYPLTFAANYTDDYGTPLNLVYDNETGSVEVSEIGMAFVLLTKSCVERMCAAYPELRFIGVTGEYEHLLFAPMVLNERIMSEDWSFCYRWKKIGGKVRMVPDVALSHIGYHAFKGSFKEAIEAQMRDAGGTL